MKKTVLFFILGLCQTIAVIAQVTVNGRVSDTSGLPIPGATVHEKGTQNGVITDVNGNYRIQVSGEQSILVFSFVGMET